MSIVNGIKSKVIIWLFGTKKKHRDIDLKNIKSILLNPKDSIGDTLMSFCYARQLKKMYPDIKLGIVVTNRNLEFTKLCNENEKYENYRKLSLVRANDFSMESNKAKLKELIENINS